MYLIINSDPPVMCYKIVDLKVDLCKVLIQDQLILFWAFEVHNDHLKACRLTGVRQV